ncbi:MAG: hypothetical protein WD767_20145 [Alphaproteobacteria bacterium]
MTCPDYLARLCAIDARYDAAPPRNAEYLAATGDTAHFRAQRAAAQSRYFDQMARNAQRAIQAQCRYRTSHRFGARLSALSTDLRSARRQGLWWHDRKTQASRSA